MAKDPIMYRHRYHKVDILAKRQLLGDISHDEVNHLNRVISSHNKIYFTK